MDGGGGESVADDAASAISRARGAIAGLGVAPLAAILVLIVALFGFFTWLLIIGDGDSGSVDASRDDGPPAEDFLVDDVGIDATSDEDALVGPGDEAGDEVPAADIDSSSLVQLVAFQFAIPVQAVDLEDGRIGWLAIVGADAPFDALVFQPDAGVGYATPLGPPPTGVIGDLRDLEPFVACDGFDIFAFVSNSPEFVETKALLAALAWDAGLVVPDIPTVEVPPVPVEDGHRRIACTTSGFRVGATAGGDAVVWWDQ